MKNIYVGNIPSRATAGDLAAWFGKHGTVTGARIVSERGTGRPLGFGFVEMARGAEAAVAALHGSQMEGRVLAVHAQRPRGQAGNAHPGAVHGGAFRGQPPALPETPPSTPTIGRKDGA